METFIFTFKIYILRSIAKDLVRDWFESFVG